MKNLLKSQSGMAIVLIIIIVVVGVAGGGAAILGVRALVTGENYFAPFENMGWISLDHSNDKKDKDEDVAESIVEAVTTLEDADRLSDEVKEADISNVSQYYGVVSMADQEGYTSSDEDYEIYDSLKMEWNIFGVDDEVVEIVVHVDCNDYMEKYYEAYESIMVAGGYDTYEDFKAEMLPLLDDELKEMFDDDEEYSDYIDYYSENGIIEMYVTDKGLEKVYETYNITEGDNAVEKVVEAVEECFDITMEKVN